MQTLHNLYREDPEVFASLQSAMQKPPRTSNATFTNHTANAVALRQVGKALRANGTLFLARVYRALQYRVELPSGIRHKLAK